VVDNCVECFRLVVFEVEFVRVGEELLREVVHEGCLCEDRFENALFVVFFEGLDYASC